jgi:hypothetical protein
MIFGSLKFILLSDSLIVWIRDKNKKWESFVYLKIGIWRGPDTNKQYPTLVQYEVDTESADITYGYKI